MDKKMQSNAQHTKNLIFELKKSGAPRFLVSMLQLPEGLYLLELDHEALTPDNREGQLEVRYEDDIRHVSLTYVNTFDTAAAKAQGLEPVYTFFVINGDHLGVTHSMEQSAPENPQYVFSIQDLANLTSIEDFCEIIGLQMVESKSGTEPTQSERV